MSRSSRYNAKPRLLSAWFAVPFECLQGVPAIVERVRGLRSDRQRALAARDRIRVAGEQIKDVAAVRPRLCRCALAGGRAVEQIQRLGQAALASAQYAEQVECVEVIGHRLQNRSADRLDLVKTSKPIGLRRTRDRFRQ